MRKLLKSVVYRGNYIWLWKCSKLKIVRGWKSIRGQSVIYVYLVLIFSWALLMGTWSRILRKTDLSLPQQSHS